SNAATPFRIPRTLWTKLWFKNVAGRWWILLAIVSDGVPMPGELVFTLNLVGITSPLIVMRVWSSENALKTFSFGISGLHPSELVPTCLVVCYILKRRLFKDREAPCASARYHSVLP